jgi:tRNA 2-thiocytidine biosynthesis protein TtcA
LIKKYAKEQGLLSIENRCSTSATSKRMHIKKILQELEGKNIDVRDNIFKALRHVKLDYLPQNMKDMK